jgi:GTPase SAR1 family protein
LDAIKDQVGGVRLARTELVDQAHEALERDRTLHIVGAPGVGKSSVMKHLARRLQPEGRIIVLRNGRIIPGGWLRMAHEIGSTVSQDELFSELGCGGGATLFIDNIDQIDEAGDWATYHPEFCTEVALSGNCLEAPRTVVVTASSAAFCQATKARIAFSPTTK